MHSLGSGFVHHQIHFIHRLDNQETNSLRLRVGANFGCNSGVYINAVGHISVRCTQRVCVRSEGKVTFLINMLMPQFLCNDWGQ